ncbi:MAG TPA: DUF4242 domain-containing protein [Nakamurella sp.]
MDRYVIERSLPGAGGLTDEEIHDLSARYNQVANELGEGIVWVESFVGDNKLYCVYEAERPALIRQHAAIGGFPCDSMEPVRRTISPADGR